MPFTPRPVPGETVASYLTRLADANHMKPADLAEYIWPGLVRFLRRHDDFGLGRNPLPTAALERLATFSGRSLNALGRALPTLSITGGNGVSGRAAAACRSCLAHRAVSHQVLQHRPSHQHVCLRHGRWLDDEGQTQLFPVPEVIHAQRRLLRLARHRTSAQLHYAELSAREVLRRWHRINRYPELGVRWHRRADSLGEDQPDPDRSRALFYLVVHPEAVTLASMFASPYWQPLCRAVSLDGNPPPETPQLRDELQRRFSL
ncbi:TniQ family protein [Streptomyces malaysiensis]|uniref:TniQ family protein n=1 Tax=Streptomyces malaysiensis TaxID=92644 RepID=UPI003FA70223